MDTTSDRVHVAKAILVGIVAFVASIVPLVVLMAAYHAAANHGTPAASEGLAAFDAQYGAMAARLLAILSAFLGARWLGRRVQSQPALHGALVGGVVATLVIAHGLAHTVVGDHAAGFSLIDVAAAIAIVAAGVGGGMSRELDPTT